MLYEKDSINDGWPLAIGRWWRTGKVYCLWSMV